MPDLTWTEQIWIAEKELGERVGQIVELVAEKTALLARLAEVEGERDEARLILAAARDDDGWDPNAMVMLYDQAMNRGDEALAENARLRQQGHDRLTRLADVTAERDAMRPVVEAAKAWRALADVRHALDPEMIALAKALLVAVDALPQGPVRPSQSTLPPVQPSDVRGTTDGVAAQGEAQGDDEGIPMKGDPRPWEELRSSGLLWLINRVVFHPRGWALALCRRNGVIGGWTLSGDGREVWTFTGDTEDGLFAAAQATLAPAEVAQGEAWTGEGCCRSAVWSEGNRHDHPVTIGGFYPDTYVGEKGPEVWTKEELDAVQGEAQGVYRLTHRDDFTDEERAAFHAWAEETTWGQAKATAAELADQFNAPFFGVKPPVFPASMTDAEVCDALSPPADPPWLEEAIEAAAGVIADANWWNYGTSAVGPSAEDRLRAENIIRAALPLIAAGVLRDAADAVAAERDGEHGDYADGLSRAENLLRNRERAARQVSP